jgi:hypothetical protein
MKPKSLLQLRELNKTLSSNKTEIYLSVLRSLCLDHPSFPESSKILALVRRKDFVALVAMGDLLSSQAHDDAGQHFLAGQFSLLLRKYPHPDSLGLKPQENAEKKFWHAEHRCKRVNTRFRLFDSLRSPNATKYDKMRSTIAYIIGDAPDVSSICNRGGFGPGASLGVHGNATNIARKLLSEKWSVTPSAHTYGRAAMMQHAQIYDLLAESRNSVTCYDTESVRASYDGRVTMVRNNKIAFVPKTAKIHRTIAVEPLINSYLQKGVDLFMRQRLKRFGVDLSDQSLNQRLAREGSIFDSEDSFVTIDLAAASDSISIELVRHLLPPDWFAFLDAIRSKQGSVDGKLFTYHKFCSMGNGFCFPLESLLFTVACCAAGCGTPGSDFAVYGDDIVVRKRHATSLIFLLNEMGFKVNPEKTFLEGRFRESCGADWFGGEDVRPFTLDFELDSLSSLFKFLNLTRRNWRTEMFFLGVRDYILSLIPRSLAFVRPFGGNADSAITVELDQFMSSPFAVWSSRLQCWSWRELLNDAVADKLLRTHSEYPKVLVIGALAGCSSTKPFTVRRKTKTKVRVYSHSGPTSLWVPPHP